MRCKQTTHFFYFIPKVVHFVLKSCTFRFGDYMCIQEWLLQGIKLTLFKKNADKTFSVLIFIVFLQKKYKQE